MRIVIALGGNAILQRGEAPQIERQRQHIKKAAEISGLFLWLIA